MDITLLDLGFCDKFGNSLDKVSQLFKIAPVLESLNYKRLWLGEHYDNDIAWRSPEILIGLLLGLTDKLRIGSAGNLLMLHSPLRLVNDFSMLESIFTNRVDMGIAGGISSKENIIALTGSDIFQMTFDEKVKILFEYFSSSESVKTASSFLKSPPYIKNLRPNTWFLSGGNSKVDLAIKYKSNYAWSIFHKSKSQWSSPNSFIQFQTKYYEVHRELPETILAIGMFCSENKKTVQRIKAIYLNKPFSTIIGSKDECTEKISSILKYFKSVKEIAVIDLSFKYNEKLESCRLVLF